MVFSLTSLVCALSDSLWTLALGLRFLPAGPARERVQHFDTLSAVLNALTFGLLILALSGIAQRQAVFLTLSELIVALLAGVFFVRCQLHQPRPLLLVDLLRIPVFSLSIGTSVCSFCAQMLVFVSLPFIFAGCIGEK